MAEQMQTEERAFYWQTPNMVDDMGLSVYAFRLYSHIRRVTGEYGVCTQSVQTITGICNMSEGKYYGARKELVDAGLIRVDVRKTDDNQINQTTKITTVNIWLTNIQRYGGTSPHEGVPHLVRGGTSPHEGGPSPREDKEYPINNTPIKKMSSDADTSLDKAASQVRDERSTQSERLSNSTTEDSLTDIHRYLLGKLGAKRFKTPAQRETVAGWADYNPTDVRRLIDWAAVKGFTLGDAVANVTKALGKAQRVDGQATGDGQVVKIQFGS